MPPAAATKTETAPKRRTKAAEPTPAPVVCEPMAPGLFFNELIQGLLASEGIAGVFSDSAISILSNPVNAPRWYGAYLTLCRNWDSFIAGEVKMSARLVPASVYRVLEEITPKAMFDPDSKE